MVNWCGCTSRYTYFHVENVGLYIFQYFKNKNCKSLLQIHIFLLQSLLKVSIVHKSSLVLYVEGMKTESEFPDVYLDFIRLHGIPSALRRDNAKSEMSQRVCQIHRDLFITDQWIEPHSPWQNPAELNGVKYLKSHAQVLLDRTGAPDSMWFLAQDYLAHPNCTHMLPSSKSISFSTSAVSSCSVV
jgi:hypothetical protein